jgi:hypothetical protein
MIFEVLTPYSAIARSRKRKLCILYEVTVSPDALPRRSFSNLDAYEHTPAERQFLDGCDILQYVLQARYPFFGIPVHERAFIHSVSTCWLFEC